MKKQLLVALSLLSAGAVSAQVHLSEDFESGMPGSWSQTTLATDGGWLAGDVNSLSSQFWPIATDNSSNFVATNDDDCNCDKSADYLITPSMDLTGSTTVFISFDAFFAGLTYGGATEEAFVEYSTDGGNSWSVLMAVTGDANAWTSNSMDASSQLGGSNVLLAFRYQDNGGWLYGYAVDNVNVFSPSANDAAVTALTFPAYAQVGTNVAITGEISNMGSNAITSLDLTYDAGSGPVTETVSVSIPPLGTANFSHTTQFNVAAAQTYNVDVSVSLAGDGDASNDMMSGTISGLANVPTKMVVGEEATGTWCGWCPRGSDWMEYMAATYPGTWAGVAVHNSDPMVVTDYDAGMGAIIGGYPSSTVDRMAFADVDPSTMEAAYNVQIQEIPPANIQVASTVNGSTVDITITATFEVALSNADLRLNAVVTENNVTGTSSQYDQANYYSFQSNNLADPLAGFGLDWQAENNPVAAADMVYDHVGRAITGGFNGAAGSVPATVTAGQQVSYTASYTIPAGQDVNEMHIVGILHDNATGRILNAGEASVGLNSGIASVESNFDVKVFPNPTSDVLNVRMDLPEASNIQVEVVNVVGQTISSEAYGSIVGDQVLMVDVTDYSAGMYYLNITVDGERVTKTFNVSK